ncbi:NAD(P)-dependent dehydrogenase, short-chain alcohol dehydrogenase family [Natronoarchaeum philippinense]|uniref:NAD(P)-dependent dehydrogenase, short-chain alcohol dehydrogenase family n=1 Tax=Natronoarchaeum philippinense TaxID=558529 RepID=A0A285P7H8_NATPI|nr:oxidoreductase [Natronoarchaeum philippinense]SNZ17217.1 NAD(P)-dependent dehydrogenase, short-chain alcohol dehydrogenase family [Natronoarchaeum philippinense]
MPNDKWTAAQMPDLSDRTVVVTGANSGIGAAATREFARKGAHVVMACRSTDRGEEARAAIESEVPEASLSVRECDLGDRSSIRAFAEKFRDRHDALDVLCNNAGVMAIPYRETTDGIERQFGVNHLGHFALTGYLLHSLREADGQARVVTQSSGLHERGDIDVERVRRRAQRDGQPDDYDRWAAYGRSKLANVLFAYELDRRLDATGANVASTACHPGYAATNLQTRGAEMTGSTVKLWFQRAANRLLAQSADDGALPMLYAATAADVQGGEYIGPGGFMNMRGHPERQRSSDLSYDRELAAELWGASEELTGVTYDLERPATTS